MKHVEYNIFRWSIRENIKILFLAKQLRPHQFNFLFIGQNYTNIFNFLHPGNSVQFLLYFRILNGFNL